ncbi:MAG: adenylosuccinate lyase [Candidatus Tectomicrobia bacterium]|nr:adenylosuccinate lyase [Candidatus Tectomicrobia bacterium]
MISRYTRPEMTAIWSEETKLGHWLEIECLACEAMEGLGLVPAGTAEEVRRRVVPDPERVAEIEKATRHDVIAFLVHVEEQAGEPARHLHLGMTSSDVLDTCLSLQMVAAARLILQDLAALKDVLHRRAGEFKDRVMIGRTHGMHAEPVTFGFKLALWYDEFVRSEERVMRAMEAVRVGMVSGAVGTYAHLSPKVEAYVCERLGLRPVRASSQIIHRDRHAEYLSALALTAASVANVATEIRHLSRSEVGEVAEGFGARQKGSSAMPHKRNPVLSEQLAGLARLVGANASAALQNVPLWHERDISHSSVERVILPDSATLVDYMLVRLAGILEGLAVNADAMERNLALGRGLFHSEQVLLELIRSGLARQRAYEAVQRCAFRAMAGEDFRAALAADPEVRKRLTDEALDRCFDLKPHLAHIEVIFARVFGPRKSE